MAEPLGDLDHTVVAADAEAKPRFERREVRLAQPEIAELGSFRDADLLEPQERLQRSDDPVDLGWRDMTRSFP